MADHNQSDIEREAARRRFRDFVILTFGAVSVLTLLLLSGSVGVVEWLTGGIVMTAGALAYFVGSLPAPTNTSLTPEEAQQDLSQPDPLDLIAPYIQALPLPTLLINNESRIKLANNEARKLFRMEATSNIRATAAIRHPSLLEALERVAQSASGERVEVNLEGDAETWMAHFEPGPGQGTVMIVFEDLTAVRRAELARADFLANASHELRTPLTAVGGFIETMRGPAKDDKASWDGFLEIMHFQTERMKRLVKDLLSLSRIEFSEHSRPSSRIDAAATTANASMSLQPIAEAASVQLNLNIPNEPAEIIADEDELTQVIQNLTSNAIKYSPNGSLIEITVGTTGTMAEAAVQAARQIDGADRAILMAPRASSEVPGLFVRIADNGVGIPPQHLPRLGERFYRVDESRGGQIEGTGLGLAIVKHVMARHRGGLAVESMQGVGTAFGIWMPLAKIT
ncbi:MAG: ATP-binding protein [Henriciella sp.]